MIKETDTCEEIDLSKWRQLRDDIFEKYKDEEGYYFSSTGSYWEMRKLNGVMNYLKQENEKMLGFNPVNQMRILKNKEKYNEKNASEILDFIFKGDK